MAIEKTEAIVLRTWKYGDTSRIVSAYTRRFGRMRLIAKGARGAKSRYGASLEPFTESLLVLYLKRDRELQLLSSADTIDDFPRLRQGAARLGFGCATVEAIERLTGLEQEDPALYARVRAALVAIGEAPDDDGAEWAFWRSQKGLLAALGYRWELEACVACGGAVYGSRVAIDPVEGALCGDCAAGRNGSATIGSATREALIGGLASPAGEPALAEIRRLFGLFYERCGLGRGTLRSLGYLSAVADGEVGPEAAGPGRSQA